MAEKRRYTFEQLQEAISHGYTPEELALKAELDETRALIYEAFAAMTTTSACQSVVYADMARYLDGLTDDFLVEAEHCDEN